MENLKPQKKLEALVGKTAKTSYKNLSPEECRLIRLFKSITQLVEGKSIFLRNVTEGGYEAATLDYDWDFFDWMEKKQRAQNKKIFFLKIKNNWTDDDVTDIFYTIYAE